MRARLLRVGGRRGGLNSGREDGGTIERKGLEHRLLLGSASALCGDDMEEESESERWRFMPAAREIATSIALLDISSAKLEINQ